MRQPPYTLPLNALLPSPSDEPTGRPIISAGISANYAPENVKKFVADGGPVTAILIGPSIQTTIQGQAGCETLLSVLLHCAGRTNWEFAIHSKLRRYDFLCIYQFSYLLWRPARF